MIVQGLALHVSDLMEKRARIAIELGQLIAANHNSLFGCFPDSYYWVTGLVQSHCFGNQHCDFTLSKVDLGERADLLRALIRRSNTAKASFTLCVTESGQHLGGVLAQPRGGCGIGRLVTGEH